MLNHHIAIVIWFNHRSSASKNMMNWSGFTIIIKMPLILPNLFQYSSGQKVKVQTISLGAITNKRNPSPNETATSRASSSTGPSALRQVVAALVWAKWKRRKGAQRFAAASPANCRPRRKSRTSRGWHGNWLGYHCPLRLLHTWRRTPFWHASAGSSRCAAERTK